MANPARSRSGPSKSPPPNDKDGVEVLPASVLRERGDVEYWGKQLYMYAYVHMFLYKIWIG